MKNYSDITESLDITTKQYVDQGLSSKADTSELNKRVKLSATNATVGATDKPIYVQNGIAVVATDVMKEAFLQWGGKNFSANYGPLDAALISDLGADRFAFIPAAKWQVEYSRDNGGTWQDYGATDAQKLSLTSVGTGLTIGNANSEHNATANDKLRLTLTTSGCVYSVLNKFAIDVSTNGSAGCYVTIEGRTKANVDAGVDTWVEFAKDITISGWSGWNIINTSGITTHGNTNNQYANLRFTFGCTGGNISEGSSYHGLQIRRLKAFGGVGWQTPSNMAQYGSLYRYDYSQNALFPADVYIRNNIKVASINDVNKKQDIISDTNKLSASLVSGLATVATSGSYDDLSHKPTIPDISGKANLSGGNTFTGKQTLNSPASDGYSINAAGYIKGSWLQSGVKSNYGSGTGMVCVFDGSGWIYYRTPAEILTEAGGATTDQIHNGMLTIQKNGTTVETFSANQSSSVTANITVPTKASDVNALSLDGGTINKSKTIKMDASANSDGANLKWGTVNHKNPYIGYASDQVDGTFVVGSLLGTNYASGLAIGGGSGNLLWKGTKVATTSDITAHSNIVATQTTLGHIKMYVEGDTLYLNT